MLALTQELIDRFQKVVYDKSDLHFSGHKLVFFERQLRGRLVKTGYSDFEAYYRRLSEDSAELESLVQELTTNQTFFFRNPGHFAALKDRVFPELVERANAIVFKSWGSPGGATASGTRHPAMRMRVWSCGCSTGEETYSIAFSLLDALSYPKAWDIEILGTDIKREALEAAREGVYEAGSLKSLPVEILEKYMERRGDSWVVGEKARGLVRFCENNIKELSGPASGRITVKEKDTEAVLDAGGYFDAIFCRNVMIYFDRKGQQRLVDGLYGCLKAGGYLFTGDSEPLHLFRHGFLQAGDPESLYYKKPL